MMTAEEWSEIWTTEDWQRFAEYIKRPISRRRQHEPDPMVDEYRWACGESMGWCESCQDWTRDTTEPDARGYDCPLCDQNTVIGADEWMVKQ